MAVKKIKATASELGVTFEDGRDIVESGEAWVYTDSLRLAETLDVEHHEVLRRIRKVLKDYELEVNDEDYGLKTESSEGVDNTSLQELIFRHTDFTYAISSYKNSQNKDQPYYKLSKDLLVLAIFSFSRLDKAKELQKAYIAEFNRKEKELQWFRARYNGIDVRNSLTDNVRDFLPDAKWYDYMNFTNLVYEAIFGLTAKDIREMYGLDKKQNVRELLSEDCIKDVEALENEMAVFLSYGMNYDQISAMIKKKFEGKEHKNIEILMKQIA